MSDSTDSGSSRNPLDPSGVLDAGPDQGQEQDADSSAVARGESRANGSSYVDGDYGDAGAVDEAAASSDAEGEYTSGDFGNAGGSEAGSKGSGEGGYPDGDYGAAGGIGSSNAAGGTRDMAEGEYPEGDYGEAGQVKEDKYPKTERPWEGS